MPVIKAADPLPERAVVLGLYGEPGVSKTTLANTANLPILIDFDRGIARSLLRKDYLQVNDWSDVIAEEKAGTFKQYKTAIIDTAKAALDDFLMPWVVKNDFKLQKNKLQAYGAIGDEFKLFVNRLRNEGIDVIVIAHAKKDEDTKMHIPDITGQSYNLVMRICDQIGYVSIQNNKRTIEWNPTERNVGKNTAAMEASIVPDKTSEELRTFMAGILQQVRESIVQQSEAQREAMEKLQNYEKQIKAAKTAEALSDLITPVQGLPKTLAAALNTQIGAKAKAKGWTWVKEKKVFEDPKAKKPDPEPEPEPEHQEEDLSSTFAGE
jgi:hypothetical protein